MVGSGGLPATDTSQTCHVPSGLQGVSLDGARACPLTCQERDSRVHFAPRYAHAFHPHSGPKARCYQRLPLTTCRTWMFQSSPGPKARCYRARPGPTTVTVFNPHRARRPGATAASNAFIVASFVSSSRPEGPVLTPRSAATPDLRVFILTGPEGRCYLAYGKVAVRDVSFNPHRARRPGAWGLLPGLGQSARSFNPHRARRPGATRRITGSRHRWRFNPHGPEGPVLPGCGLIEGFEVVSSSPARRPGATSRRRLRRKTSRFILTGPEGPVLLRTWRRRRIHIVSSSPGLEGPVLPSRHLHADAASAAFSILTGPEGPVLPARWTILRAARTRVHPHRARRPGATGV